jgi:hypothetical protein
MVLWQETLLSSAVEEREAERAKAADAAALASADAHAVAAVERAVWSAELCVSEQMLTAAR